MGKIDACVVLEDQFWTTVASLAAQAPGGWGTYESLKRFYVDSHPNASPDNYDAAMSRLKALAGVSID